MREGAKLGYKCIGFDVNPLAAKLSATTCSPPNLEVFESIVEPILEKFYDKCRHAYTSSFGQEVKYVVHEVQVKCPSCGNISNASTSNKKGRASYCQDCGSRVNFNLKSLVSTVVNGVVLSDGKFEKDPSCISEQKKLSSTSIALKSDNRFNKYFPENKRILSYDGMKTSDLFTERNFGLLCWLADKFHQIDDIAIRDAALLLLTASSAQCSRLIAYRNNMKTGGPAWSVPGFWVPPIHLETNPLYHLKARYRKFIKGLGSLSEVHLNDCRVIQDDCRNIGKYSLPKADVIFLDPPYGDSVPYVEFSMIWNSFLDADANADLDISVSDRKSERKKSWDNYEKSLLEIIDVLKNSLSKDGKFLLTFNNHDLKAWQSLLGAFQANSLLCTNCFYQIPAVVSSKAQFNPESSYVSDLYAVFTIAEDHRYISDLSVVGKDLIRAANLRGNKLTKSMLYRNVFLSFVENNVNYKLLTDIDALVEELFTEESSVFFLKSNFVQPSPSVLGDLSQVCVEVFREKTREGSCKWDDLFLAILEQLKDIGLPDPSEVKFALKDHMVMKDKKCIPISNLSIESEPNQSRLF